MGMNLDSEYDLRMNRPKSHNLKIIYGLLSYRYFLGQMA